MPLVHQFASFAMVGAVGTAVHYGVLLMLVTWAGLSPVASTSAGAIAGAIVNYVLNYRFTFDSRIGHARGLRRFMTVAALGVLVNAAIVDIGVRAMHTHYLLAQVVATAAVLCLGFAVNRAWTFREDRRASR